MDFNFGLTCRLPRNGHNPLTKIFALAMSHYFLLTMVALFFVSLPVKSRVTTS